MIKVHFYLQFNECLTNLGELNYLKCSNLTAKFEIIKSSTRFDPIGALTRKFKREPLKNRSYDEGDKNGFL
jgi:hypothetical protein